jgi:PKD repeat protein
MPGIYTVKLTVFGPGGSDTISKLDYIDVLCFESDFDGDNDVDGYDLATFARGGIDISPLMIAAEFGRNKCQ